MGVLDLLAEGRPDEVMPKAVLADASLEPERMRWAGQIDSHPEAALPAERFPVLIDNMHRAGEICRERGFDPVLHFHAGSYCETGSEIHQVFDALDTDARGHVPRHRPRPLRRRGPAGAARGATATASATSTSRTATLTCSQEVCQSGGGLMEAWDRGVFCELGLGTAGLDGFLEALKARGYEGWMTVEQDRFLKPEDTPEALLALHTRNREWLAARGF